MIRFYIHRHLSSRVTYLFVAAIFVERPLCAEEAPSTNADSRPSPALADEFLKAFKDTAGGSFYSIALRAEQQLDQGGDTADTAAQGLLAIKQDLVTNRAVLDLLDQLAAQERRPPAARLLVQIARAKLAAPKIKPPNVVVGQLIVEDGKTDPTLVLAQMPILEDGYFAGEIGDLGRPVSFRSHGYEDLDVPLEDKGNDVVYVGQVTLKPLAAERQASLKGKVVLDDASGSETSVVTLNVAVGPINTPHNGYSGRMRWPEGIKVRVSETGEFQVDGLNPSAYNVSVSADSHVDLNKNFTLTADQQLEIGTFRLFCSDLGFYIGKPAPDAGDLAWEPDFDTALKRGQSEKRPLLVMMTASWCGPCKLLEEQTLSDAWIRHFLSPFVLVKAYENREVERKYGLRGYPSLVLIDSSGKAVHTCVGYMPAFTFAGHYAQALRNLSPELPPEIQTLIDKKVITLPVEN